jgi:hypothetical protein
MPKNGSSRSKRRARRLAAEENLRYTEALRLTGTGEREPERDDGDEAPVETGPTALDAVQAIAERVKASDPADTAVALATIYEALSLTATANRMIHDALSEFEYEVYWPGEGFLDGARQQHLDLAVEWLGSSLSTPTRPLEHDRMQVLTPPDVAPREYHPYQPDGWNGVVYDPDSVEKARQLLLHRTQSVALANKSVWVQVGDLLARVRDPHSRKACRIAALVVDEIAHPDSGRDRRGIDRRILAITVGRRDVDELVADEQLMQLLHKSVAAAARPNGWSPISGVSAALERADADWMPQRWGYLSDIKLISATGQFSMRRLPRQGQQVIEVRARRGSTGKVGR